MLSAGLGKRLRPLTLTTPKCLVEINGEPLLINWLNKLESVGCNEVLINTHYFANKVEEVIKKWNKKSLKITTVFEENLLGTAGTLRENIKFFQDSEVLLIHADNYTNLNLEDFLNSFRKRDQNCVISMLTFLTNNPEECGIVETNEKGVLIDYFEKFNNPPSNIANGAIFAFDNNFLELFSSMDKKNNDFCRDIIPLLKGQIQTYFTNCLFIDIGRPSSLKLARQLVK